MSGGRQVGWGREGDLTLNHRGIHFTSVNRVSLVVATPFLPLPPRHAPLPQSMAPAPLLDRLENKNSNAPLAPVLVTGCVTY